MRQKPVYYRGLLFAFAGGATLWLLWELLWPSADVEPAHPLSQGLSSERMTNASFASKTWDSTRPPRITDVSIPIKPGDHAIWGSTGRHHLGSIWFATSSYKHPILTARLYEVDPVTNRVTERGDVLGELSKLGLSRPHEEQPKIHTKIVEGGDGHLYFASMDEPRPGEVGQRTPPWGSHLWRLNMPGRKWEHLARFEEGLIALAGGGGYVFALAFPDHTLISYDLSTGAVEKVIVGSVEGHISRNIFTDYRGHVYVPRLRFTRPNHADHTLVEFDECLTEVGENLIRDYQLGAADQSHGIVAFQQLADRSIVFTTHAGRLLRVVPDDQAPASLIDLGWFHPDGRTYPASLFTDTGERLVGGVAFSHQEGKPPMWVVHNLASGKSTAEPFSVTHSGEEPFGVNWLLYGCQTTDVFRRAYVVGARPAKGGRQPVLLQLQFGD